MEEKTGRGDVCLPMRPLEVALSMLKILFVVN